MLKNTNIIWHRVDLRLYAGRILIAISVLHLLVALIAYAGPLADIANAGFVNAVDTYPDRDAAFWFFMAGVLFLIIGGLAHWAQTQTGRLPAFLGWSFLIMALPGVMLMPVSGFWLMIPLGLLLLAAARSETRPA